MRRGAVHQLIDTSEQHSAEFIKLLNLGLPAVRQKHRADRAQENRRRRQIEGIRKDLLPSPQIQENVEDVFGRHVERRTIAARSDDRRVPSVASLADEVLALEPTYIGRPCDQWVRSFQFPPPIARCSGAAAS
jgi:hypothetical protein